MRIISNEECFVCSFVDFRCLTAFVLWIGSQRASATGPSHSSAHVGVRLPLSALSDFTKCIRIQTVAPRNRQCLVIARKEGTKCPSSSLVYAIRVIAPEAYNANCSLAVGRPSHRRHRAHGNPRYLTIFSSRRCRIVPGLFFHAELHTAPTQRRDLWNYF